MASETPTVDNRLVTALLASLENERRLIAVGKIQCWEIVKWAVTLNIAIAGAQVAALNATSRAVVCLALGGLALLVWYIGRDLLRHTCDGRMRGSRKAAWLLEEHLETEYAIDPRAIAQQSKLEPRENNDEAVLKPYSHAILLSLVPAALLAGWAVYRAAPGGFSS